MEHTNPNPNTNTSKGIVSRMKRPLAYTAAAAAIMVGGLSAASVVSAQTDSGDDPAVTQDGGEERDGERRRGGRGCGGHKHLDTVAEVIGIEESELRAALEDGQSVADVAEANGVDPQEVVDALVAEAEARLDAKVEDGRLTEEEAADKLAEKTDRIEDRIDDTATDDDEA